MGKSKSQKSSKKDQSLFKVAGNRSNKAKDKTKPIKTNLKKLNLQNKKKTDVLNKELEGVQESMLVTARGGSGDAKHSKQKARKPEPMEEAPDIDKAAEEMAKL